MKKFKIAYFGSSDFSARLLEKLINDQSINRLVTIEFVVTQPDRPSGRKQVLTPTPVKSVALKYGLNIFEINNFKIKNSLKILNLKLKIRELDLVLLYAYAGIVPQEFLDLPKFGFWCLHPSLLPKYRGTSPMATALINGDKKTGMTIIKMDEQIDHGPIIAQENLMIEEDDKRPDLEKKLTDLGFQLFVQSINQLDNIEFQEQNHQQATYTKKLKKEDGFVPLNLLIPRSSKNEVGKIENSPEEIFNLYRGLFPWPGLWTILPNGKRLKITDIKLLKFNNFLTLKLLKVQLEGKKEIDFETFNKAYKIF